MNKWMTKFAGTKYYYGLMMVAFMISTGRHASAKDTQTCSVDGQTWLTNIGSLVQDPVKWIMYLTGVTAVIFISWGGFLIKTSKGRQDKLDKGWDLLKYWGVGSIIIFSASGLGTWYLGKFGCVLT